jgi:DNA-binding XRE family transcriptional regulator
VGVATTRTRLAEYLFFAQLSQVKAAERVGVSRQILHDAYHGRPISTDSWLRIANGLGCSISQVAPPDVVARILAVA